MATIPVEKKAAAPWWLWLLGALLLGLLVWFFLLRNDDDEVVDNTEEVAPPAALDLSDAWVTRVVGDNTFFVAPDSAGTDETLVYLEEEPDPTDDVEGRYDVTAGQNLALTGALLPLAGVDTADWGVSTDDLAARDQYVRASALTILNDGMADDGMMDDGMMDDSGMDDAAMDDAGMDAGTMDDGADAATGAVTRIDDLYAADLSALVGRTVEVDDARVLSVVGDSTFYLGDGNRRILVALSNLGESQSGAGDGSDGRFDINVGDRVNLRGTVTRFDAANSAFRKLSAADRSSTSTRGAFVNVTSAAGLTKR